MSLIAILPLALYALVAAANIAIEAVVPSNLTDQNPGQYFIENNPEN